MSIGCWSAFRIWKKTAAKIFKMLWLVSFVWRMGTKLVIGRPKLGSFCLRVAFLVNVEMWGVTSFCVAFAMSPQSHLVSVDSGSDSNLGLPFSEVYVVLEMRRGLRGWAR